MADYPSFNDTGGKPIAYVRTVRSADLPDDVRAEMGDAKAVYAIHAADGKVLALVDDRSKAFMLARMNEFAPVSVH